VGGCRLGKDGRSAGRILQQGTATEPGELTSGIRSFLMYANRSIDLYSD
jgi:hypothetical protein